MVLKLIFHRTNVISAIEHVNQKSVKKRHNFAICGFLCFLSISAETGFLRIGMIGYLKLFPLKVFYSAFL